MDIGQKTATEFTKAMKNVFGTNKPTGHAVCGSLAGSRKYRKIFIYTGSSIEEVY
jgi:hypothetical protein